nr:helix-turn-helix domain-containing protein [uncultured Gellertiella sp.]
MTSSPQAPPDDRSLAFNVYSENCPTRLVIDRLGDKWAILILNRLAGGTMRFNRLRRDIEGISQKVLSQVLKKLERDGLVSRTAYPTVPVTVEYAITPLGQTLASTVAEITRWAEANMPLILDAQRQYDQAN